MKPFCLEVKGDYACISLLIQTKDDIRFIIPYVEFAKDMKSIKPLVLDTSCVIDGRIADVMETKLLDNPLIMPRFVLQELQNIADSGDRLRRGRGRRGLDILNKLRNSPDVDFQIFDRELPGMDGQPVDMKLVLLAKHLDGKLVTGDYNLNKVAQLHNVHVLNLNDLSNALKPLHLPGEHLAVLIVKAGEGEGQGVGYLDDGTMIVVVGEHAGLVQRGLLNSRQQPNRLVIFQVFLHVPDFIHVFRSAIVFAQLAGKTHAGNRPIAFIGHFQQFAVDGNHIGFLRCIVAFLHLHGDFGEHFRCGVFADVVQVLAIIGGLQANKRGLGATQKAFHREIGGMWPVAGAASRANFRLILRLLGCGAV